MFPFSAVFAEKIFVEQPPTKGAKVSSFFHPVHCLQDSTVLFAS